ncbi:MAG: hypothetical protein V3S11_05870 [Elusimicrobiota bacterium]
MRGTLPLSICLALGCASTPHAPEYSKDDPLANRPPVIEFDGFRAALPHGYRKADGRLTAPILAMMTKPVSGGEAAIIVEHYPDSAGQAAFLRNLGAEGGTPPPKEIAVDGKPFTVYPNLEYIRYVGLISAGDPYADSLGSTFRPPRLSVIERRRFLTGGEAFRLYRCRRLRAWGILGDYRRLRRKNRLGEFHGLGFGPPRRKIVATCFGRSVLFAIQTGKNIPKIPKPSMYRLRILARDEWRHGASRRVERECIHLRDWKGGFLVLRFRAPRDAYRSEFASFEAFLETFAPLSKEP